jgi:hypothetical protein
MVYRKQMFLNISQESKMNTKILVPSLLVTVTVSYFFPNQVHAQQRNWITYCQNGPAREDVPKCNTLLRSLGEVNALDRKTRNRVMCPLDFSKEGYAGEICRLDNEIQYHRELKKVYEETDDDDYDY